MIELELPRELEARLAALAAEKKIAPAQYVSELLGEFFRLPDPANWFARLSAAARTECAEVIAAAARHVPGEEAIPAYLPLADAAMPSRSLHVAEDCFAIFLELVSTLYLETYAADPQAPKTGELAGLETALAERYFCTFSFADFRAGVLNDPNPDGRVRP
jgi:hypothetical protein